jgi:hypothetical protein
MSHFLIGDSIAASFFLLLNWIRRRQIRIPWWQWIPTVLGFLYAAFVLFWLGRSGSQNFRLNSSWDSG